MTLLEQERERAAAASREALVAQTLYKFFVNHPDILPNAANEGLLRDAVGDDTTLSSLEFVYSSSTTLQNQLSRRNKRELAEFTADEAREAAKKLKGMTKEELYADGKRKQQEQLDAATRKAIPPPGLTREAYTHATREQRRRWLTSYTGRVLDQHWAQQEGR